MIWKVIRQSLKRSIYEYMIYFFTLGIGVVAFYSYAVLLDKHFRTDMGLSASFSVLSDKVLYAAPFIFLMPTMLIIYIERFLYIRKQKELAILIASGLRQSKAAYIYCIERMVVALLGISTGMISGGMVSSLVLYRHFVYIGEKLVIKPLFYPFTILLTYGYFMLVIVVLSFYYGRKIMKSAVVDLLRTTEDNKPEKNAGGRSGIFALAAGYTCFVYVSGIIICIMLVCFDYFPMIYRLLSIVCVVMPVLLLGIFIKNRDRYYNKISLCIERLLKPHKYSVFKAVKSGKKQGNVGNSYFIPAPLLYRYSYILSNCDFAFLHHYNILFYFFYFCFQPIKFSLSINLFCNI